MKLQGNFSLTGRFRIGAGSTLAGDPYWDNVSLLLPLDSNTNDISSNQHATTLYNATLSSEQAKFGTNSLKFTGLQTERLEINADVSVALASATALTVEAWVYLPDNPPLKEANYTSTLGLLNEAKNVLAGEQGLWFQALDANGNAANGNGSIVTQYCLRYKQGPGVDGVNASIQSLDKTFPVNTWAHVAWVFHNGEVLLFVNGEKSNTTVLNGTQPNNFWINTTRPLDIGRGYNDAGVASWIPPWGYVNDFRITTGVARYTENFTPPTEAFPTN